MSPSSNPSTASAVRDPRAPVSVVLINWNGADDTLDTLASLEKVGDSRLRPLVVDNGSTDNSVERLRQAHPDLEIVETGKNLGFAGGNLAGIRHALQSPEVGWLLLLNTDVEVAEDFLEPLIQACLDPEVAASGPKIFYHQPAERLWAAGGELRWRETVTQEWGRGELDGPRFSQPRDVTYLTTCCLMVPRDAMEAVGPLDPVYFINVDDADWCRRAMDLGYRLRYEPGSVLWHKVAASTAGSYTPLKTFHTGRSNAIFARRHGRPWGLLRFVLANLLALPAAGVRELPKGNLRSVVSKGRGVLDGLRAPLPAVPSAQGEIESRAAEGGA
ncbi:MAG: glycosyltransferase family 2 protein [Acidobacteriota bacterium]